MRRIKIELNWVSALFLFLSLSFLVAPQAFAGDLSGFVGEPGTLRISGGTAHIPVMKESAGLIMRKVPDIRVSIAGGGSGVGIKQVGEGLVDIGNSGRKPTLIEVEKYGLIIHRWALDGVGVIVNRDNPVAALSSSRLQDIFSGRIDNWSKLGWKDKKITIITRDQASGTRKVFWKKALEKGTISSRALVVPSNGAMKSAVLNNPYAIGYASVGFLDDSVAAVALDGVAPTLKNVRSGAYPVVRGIYSNTRGTAHGLAAEFINFLYSKTGQEIILRKGLIPVAR
ncbi:MAG: phosphate ABC transporter substrate-binding protein [Deltaproteobacteria bacterium]|nr:phosphate ABC transporter substrate-binding protein [Deltaproteobacteria bacterium]